jgi:hypothetical protein
VASFILGPFLFTATVVALVTGAHVLHWVSAKTAARILIGIPLAISAAAEVWLAVVLVKDGNIAFALFAQIPLVLLVLAFVGALHPAGGWVMAQAMVCGLLLLVSLITIFTAGLFIFWIDVLLFFGMLYTAAAAADQPNRRNDAYWRYYFSRNA